MSVQIPTPKELYNQALSTPWTEVDAKATWRVFYSPLNERRSLTGDDIDRCLISALRQCMRLGRMEFAVLQDPSEHAHVVTRCREAGYIVWPSTELSLWSRVIRLDVLPIIHFDLDPPRFDGG